MAGKGLRGYVRIASKTRQRLSIEHVTYFLQLRTSVLASAVRKARKPCFHRIMRLVSLGKRRVES